MKMKKITLLTTALLLGTVTLTSCGDAKVKEAEKIEFTDYSTETTLDKYQEAHTKYSSTIDLSNTDGYDFTKYYYQSTVIEGDTTTTTAQSSKEASKYDKATGALKSEYSYYAFDNSESVRDGELSYSTVVQKNDKGIDIVNEATKTYTSSEATLDYYLMTSANISNYVDALTGTVDASDTTKQVKYYVYNNVYTLKLTIKTEDERTEGTIKLKETTSTETVFQFYASDSEVYGKSTTDKVVELEYTDGDKTGKVKKTEKTINTASVKIGAQSLSKVDISNYTKETY